MELYDLLPPTSMISIADIGAMLLDSNRPFYHGLVEVGRARVFAFEPDKTECDKLNLVMGNGYRIFPNFVGDGGPATYYQTNHAMTGSLFPPNRKLLEIFTNLAELTTLIATHAVETTRLDDVLGDQDVDLLKIDVQGSELMVFRNGHEVLARTTIVHTEVCFVELYEDQPLFAEIDQFLRKAGFQFHTFLGFGQRTYKPIICNNDINAGINQHLWSDAIYIRHSLDLPNLPLDKLVKMAILVHVLYKSYDLCHYILSEIDQQVGSSLSSAYLFFMNDSVRGSYA